METPRAPGLNLFELFIRRPVLTIMLNASLVVFGLMGLSRLPVRELPDIDPPVVTVLTVYPGAAADVVETEVTETLEEQLSSIEGINLLTSQSREQVSSIAVEFVQGRDIDVAAQDVRDRVARVRGQLPADIEEPVVAKQDAAARPIMWVALFGEGLDMQEVTRLAEDQIKDRLQTVDGVSSVLVGGPEQYAVRIWIDPIRLAAHGLTVGDVERAIQVRNLELPGGRIEGSDRELSILTRGQLPDAGSFNDLVLVQDGTRTVRLGDVGRAVAGVEDERAVARFNGQPAVGLGIVRQSRANTVDVARNIRRVMAEIAPMLPPGLQVEIPYDESVFVSKAVREVWATLGIAFLLVVLVIFVFLRSVRSTVVPALAVPISIATTFGILYALNFSINIFTLLALLLAIGIVVDDSIVVLENIYRHIEEGHRPFEAAIMAMREISFAVVVTTVTLVSIFLPLTFVGGLTGRLLLEFAVSLSVAVVVSSVVALTLAPMVGARVLRPVRQAEHGTVFNYFERKLDGLNRRYDRALSWALRHRPAVLILAGLTLVLSVALFRGLDQEFLPEEDKARLVLISLSPQGSTPEYTDRMMRQVESIMAETPGVHSFFSAVALPFQGPGDPALGVMFARLDERGRPHVRDMVQGPAGLGFRIFSESEGALGFPIMSKAVDTDFGQPFQLVLTANDLGELNRTAQAVVGRLRREGFVANPRSSFEIDKPELRVEIDRDRADALGVSVAEVSRTLQLLFSPFTISTITRDGKQYDVIVQLERPDRQVPDDLSRVQVRSASGRMVPLGNLVATEVVAGPNQIERFRRQRSATIEATPVGITLGEAIARTEAFLPELLPDGFGHDWKGEARNLRESSYDLYLFMFLSVVVVYMVLGAQFESFVHPLVVMMALPLAFVGAFGLLYGLSWVNFLGASLFGWANYAPDPPNLVVLLSRIVPRIPSMNMNVFSQVGLILLVALVCKNSILIVEFANQLRARGLSPRDAVYRAARLRFRPILMTSLSTIAGILPIAIGFGGSAESRRPLGVVAVGGMLSSTLLTLLVIPVIYTFFSKLDREGRKAAEASADEPEPLPTSEDLVHEPA